MERRTFLHACNSGDLEGVKYFVSQGVDVRANNWAVRFASTRGHLEVVKYLVSQGVNVQGDNYYAVKCAANCGQDVPRISCRSPLLHRALV